MRALLAPEVLAARVREFVAAEAAGGRLDPRVGPLLERAALLGEVPRAEAPGLVGTSERQARRLVQPLARRGLLVGAKDAPLRVAFPLGETERLFPHLWAPSAVATALEPGRRRWRKRCGRQSHEPEAQGSARLRSGVLTKVGA